MKKKLPSPEHVDTLSLNALRNLVAGLATAVQASEARLARLEAENRILREENTQLHLESTHLKVDNQLLRDEIARLKNLPPRPPFRPSGMEKATDVNCAPDRTGKKRPRGAKGDMDRVSREVFLAATVPQGSRFKGYKSCFVRELVLTAELVHYRRECWVTPEGLTVIAPMPGGGAGGYGPDLWRLCLALHAQGQVTTERLTALLNDIGIEISKRQVVRLLTKGLDRFIEEDAAVLHTGLVSAPFVTVDDTGARHARGAGYTTQIGGEHFTAFRIGPSKSRLNFLSMLRGNYQDYVLNDTAFSYLEHRKVDTGLLTKLQTREPKLFSSQVLFLEHLAQNGTDLFDTGLIRIASEAGVWGSIRHHGLLGNTVIVSDDAGQFRVANHALCWIHAERLLHKLMPSTSRQARQVDAIRDLVWCFYKALKAFRQKPSPSLVEAYRHRFDRIFTIHTGYEDLNRILARLHRRRHELLKVLEHPTIPLHTNASENDLRSFVIKRKISGGTMSQDGRAARDTMLGLLKTCRKLGLSFYHYLGDRLGLEDGNNAIPPLATLVAARS